MLLFISDVIFMSSSVIYSFGSFSSSSMGTVLLSVTPVISSCILLLFELLHGSGLVFPFYSVLGISSSTLFAFASCSSTPVIAWSVSIFAETI